MTLRALSLSIPAGFVIGMLAGCGTQPEPPPPPPVQETVFGDAVGTMDRARAVEEVTQQQKRDLDAAIEASEGNRP